MMMVADVELRQLRWQCRRGLLELDLTLLTFVDRRYASLSASERAAFHRLLNTPDTQLQAWLLGSEQVLDDELRLLIKKI